MKSFSIVMIIRDDINFIECALNSINHADYPTDLFEVIVVDDGSDMPISSRINVSVNYTLNIHYLERSEKSCRNRARNYGAQKAVNEFLIIVDGDQFHSDQFLAKYNKYFSIKRNKKVVVGPRLHVYEKHLRQTHTQLMAGENPDDIVSKFEHTIPDERIKLLRLMNIRFDQLECNWHFFWSCNFCVDRELFLKIGGFDEQLSGWGIDDIELGYRLFDAGYGFDFLTSNPTFHFIGVGHINKTKYLGWLYNLQMFYQKHKDPRILQLIEIEQPIFDEFYDGMPEKLLWYDSIIRLDQKLKFYNTINPPKYTYDHSIGESIQIGDT